MATLQTLLATALAPAQEDAISVNAVHVLSLLRSGSILSQANDQTIYKFNTRVSAYLKSKKPMAKWFGAYLAMIAIDTNWNILKSNGAKWIQMLIHILEINEPPATKEIAIRAISTIFAKTYGKQEFTRDITTPHISPFLKLLFKHAQIREDKTQTGAKNQKGNVRSSDPEEEFIELDYEEEDSDEEVTEKKSSNQFSNEDKDDVSLLSLQDQAGLLSAIVPAINQILRQQSTTFRPFSGRYLNLISVIVSLSYTNPSAVDSNLLKQICEGYVLLHYSAPKDSEALMWRLGIRHVIGQIHQTVSVISKPLVVEDFEVFSDLDDASKANASNVEAPVLTLPQIKNDHNIQQNMARSTDKLHTLFLLLLAFFSTPSKVAVKFPLGTIINLVDRVLTLSSYTAQQYGVPEHRRNLFLSLLDSIHFEALNVVYKLIPLAQTMILCHTETIMHHLEVHLQRPLHNVSSEGPTTSNSRKVQLKALQLATAFLPLLTPIPKATIPTINKMVEEALTFVLPYRDPSSLRLADAVNNPHLFMLHPSSSQVALVSKFLQTVVVSAPELSLPIRALIDRWFIISASAAANGSRINGADLTLKLQRLVAQGLSVSAAFPGSLTKYSILPLSARVVQNSALINNIVHPLLPPKSAIVHNLYGSAGFKPVTGNHIESEEDSAINTREEKITEALRVKRKLTSDEGDDDLFSTARNATKRLRNEGVIESEVAKHVEKRKQGASDPASEILDSGEDSELEEIGQEEAMMNENLRNSSSHPTEKNLLPAGDSTVDVDTEYAINIEHRQARHGFTRHGKKVYEEHGNGHDGYDSTESHDQSYQESYAEPVSKGSKTTETTELPSTSVPSDFQSTSVAAVMGQSSRESSSSISEKPKGIGKRKSLAQMRETSAQTKRAAAEAEKEKNPVIDIDDDSIIETAEQISEGNESNNDNVNGDSGDEDGDDLVIPTIEISDDDEDDDSVSFE